MSPWPHRLALLTAIATVPLLFVGGVVTSRDAGMAFPDWPLSNRSVNPEGWTRDADKGSEHGHRILGAIVGLLVSGTVVAAFRTGAPRPVRVFSVVCFCGVGLQGLLGGLRVLETSTDLALVHGCVGQAVFGLLVALAYFTSAEARSERPPTRDPAALRAAAVFATLAIYLQVVLGAGLRHVQAPLYAHVLGAAIVAASVVFALAVALLRHPDLARVSRNALLLGFLLLLQVGLGLLAANALRTLGFQAKPAGAQVWLPTAHQSVGALMFAVSLLLSLRAFRAVEAPFLRGAFA